MDTSLDTAQTTPSETAQIPVVGKDTLDLTVEILPTVAPQVIEPRVQKIGSLTSVEFDSTLFVDQLREGLPTHKDSRFGTVNLEPGSSDSSLAVTIKLKPPFGPLSWTTHPHGETEIAPTVTWSQYPVTRSPVCRFEVDFKFQTPEFNPEIHTFDAMKAAVEQFLDKTRRGDLYLMEQPEPTKSSESAVA